MVAFRVASSVFLATKSEAARGRARSKSASYGRAAGGRQGLGESRPSLRASSSLVVVEVQGLRWGAWWSPLPPPLVGPGPSIGVKTGWKAQGRAPSWEGGPRLPPPRVLLPLPPPLLLSWVGVGVEVALWRCSGWRGWRGPSREEDEEEEGAVGGAVLDLSSTALVNVSVVRKKGESKPRRAEESRLSSVRLSSSSVMAAGEEYRERERAKVSKIGGG